MLASVTESSYDHLYNSQNIVVNITAFRPFFKMEKSGNIVSKPCILKVGKPENMVSKLCFLKVARLA